MSVGYGVGGGVGIGKQTALDAPAAPSLWLPITAESMAGPRTVSEDGTIIGDRSVLTRNLGMVQNSGGWEMLVDGSTIGLPLALANGNASGAYTKAALAGFNTAAPTATAASGGSLDEGDYLFYVHSVWETPAGNKFALPAGTASSAVTTTSGNKTVDLSWSAPGASPPSPFTHVGYLLARTSVDGDASTARAFAYTENTSFSDDGSKTPSSSHPLVAGAPYVHTFVKSFTPGSNPLPLFTTTVVKDNDYSQRFANCRMNDFSLNIADGDNPVSASFGVAAAAMAVKVANPTITQTVLRKFMGWQTEISLGGTFDPVNEGFTIQMSNGAAVVPGFRGRPDYRNVGYGRRSITGTLARGFENHDYWQLMMDGCRFDLRTQMWGQGITAGCFGVVDSVEIYPFAYGMIVEVFENTLNAAGANISGPDRMVEQLQFGSQVKATEGTDMRIRLFNLTSTDYV